MHSRITPVSPTSSAAYWLLAGAYAKPLPEVHPIRGAFCIPDVFTDIPYGDGKRIWTPAFGCYDRNWQIRQLDALIARQYRWLTYNCAGMPYHTDYPELADDPVRVKRDLTLIRDAGLVANVCATDDRNPDFILNSFRANTDLIPADFVCWEMNGPYNNDVARMKAAIISVRQAAPKAYTGLHFTAGHGAIYEPSTDAWRWCIDQGVKALYSQDDHWDDPAVTGKGLQSTVQFFKDFHLDVENVAFEQETTPLYHQGRTEAQGISFTIDMLRYCPGIAGWNDSGPLPVGAL